MSQSLSRRFSSEDRRLWLSIFTGLILVSVSGCRGEPEVKLVPVDGIVTLDGTPVEAANVFFAPAKGPAAKADTDKDGKFRLMTNRPGDGAVPGDFQVSIAKFVPDPATAKDPVPGMKNELPDKYNSPATSGLTATVNLDGGNTFSFPLKKE